MAERRRSKAEGMDFDLVAANLAADAADMRDWNPVKQPFAGNRTRRGAVHEAGGTMRKSGPSTVLACFLWRILENAGLDADQYPQGPRSLKSARVEPRQAGVRCAIPDDVPTAFQLRHA